MAEAMVLAVYIPAQAPGPGMAVRSTNFSCCSDNTVPLCDTADGLEHRDNIALIGFPDGWCRRTQYGGPVESGERHHASWHILVAAADGHHAVEALRSHDCLDRVRDHFSSTKE